MVQENLPAPHQGSVLFPWKLHEMLKECDNEGKGNVVSWLPNGKAFKVHKVSDFVGNILPSYFKQTKYKSFQRQLNLWGFERITRNGPEKGAYFHKQFLRDQPSLCRYLSRQRAGKKALSQQDQNAIKTHQVDKFSSQESSFMLSVSCTSKKISTIDMLPVFDELCDESALTKLLEQDPILEPICTDPLSFEGCKFFPLDTDRCDELTRQVVKFTESTSQKSQQDSAWDILQELEQGSYSASRRMSLSLIPSMHQSAQLCAV
jgi:hypothetical protein